MSLYETSKRINPILKVIIQGVDDDECPLSRLRGVPEIVELIWNYVTSYWKLYIEKSSDRSLSYTKLKHGPIYYSHSDPSYWDVDFPEPTGININMMPFVIEIDFEKTGLPDYLRSYHEKLIVKCNDAAGFGEEYGDGERVGMIQKEIGKIGYLTIHESFVDENESQRRPGLHIEAPNVNLYGKSSGDILHWGGGQGNIFNLHGGIYMASTVDFSCEVWDCKILHVKEGPQITDELGDCEHLREFLPKSKMMKSNALYWLTDRTPHESLPLSEGTYRQFFRLVTSKVSLWYEDHSTKNPLGIVPDPKITKIVRGSKFDKNKLVVVTD